MNRKVILWQNNFLETDISFRNNMLLCFDWFLYDFRSTVSRPVCTILASKKTEQSSHRISGSATLIRGSGTRSPKSI